MALKSCSKSALLTTVLQLGSEVLSAGGCSHTPGNVITGASGATEDGSGGSGSAALPGIACGDAGLVSGAWLLGAGAVWAGAAHGDEVACPHAKAPSRRHSNPRLVIVGIPPEKFGEPMILA